MKLNSKYQNPKGQLWLNVASSIYVLKDFVNLDNHIFIRFLFSYGLIKNLLPKKYREWFHAYHEAKQKAVLIKHDCRNPLPFPGQSVDHILCSHFLEHVFPEDCSNILDDFKKVLKDGATLHIILPDLEDLIKKYLINKKNNLPDAADKLIKDSLLSKESKGTLKYRLLELNGGFGLQHRWMYDHESISKILRDKGFEIIQQDESNPSYHFRLNDDSVHVLCRKSTGK